MSEQQQPARLRHSDVECWAVMSEGKKSLFLERASAEGYASKRGDAVLVPLVRASAMLALADKLAAAQEALRRERETIVIVEGRSKQIEALKAQIAELRADVAREAAK